MSSIDIPGIFDLIDQEGVRQATSINLIASENRASQAVVRAMGTVFNNKYAEGYPGKRWYGGCRIADVIEQHAIEGAKTLFGAEHANVQAHSGTSANIAAYMALIEPGSKVLAFDLTHGGHLSHGAPFNISGKMWKFLHYGVRREDQRIDTDQVRKLFAENKDIKLMVAGASSYPRKVEFAELAAIAREHGALFLADIAHISGLVAAGLHPDPVPVSDVCTMSTQKTIRGPRGGLILCRSKFASKIDRAVFPGSQGGPLMHVIAAKAIMLEEAQKPSFKTYMTEVLASAAELGRCIAESNPKRYRLITGGTDNHMVMIDVTGDGVLNGRRAEDLLEAQGIYANKNFIPYDSLPVTVTSGIRLGTPMIVSQGAVAADMPKVAELVLAALDGHDVQEKVRQFMEEVQARQSPAGA